MENTYKANKCERLGNSASIYHSIRPYTLLFIVLILFVALGPAYQLIIHFIIEFYLNRSVETFPM